MLAHNHKILNTSVLHSKEKTQKICIAIEIQRPGNLPSSDQVFKGLFLFLSHPPPAHLCPPTHFCPHGPFLPPLPVLPPLHAFDTTNQLLPSPLLERHAFLVLAFLLWEMDVSHVNMHENWWFSKGRCFMVFDFRKKISHSQCDLQKKIFWQK